MKNKLFVLLVILIFPVCIANMDFSAEYQKNIILLPDSNYTLPILIKNHAEHKLELNISCDSDLTVYCQNNLELKEKETKLLFIQVITKEKGAYSINFQINNKSNKIKVKVSNTPEALVELLDYYNFTLNRLLVEKGDLRVQEFEQADLDLQIAYGLYKQGLYYQSNEKLEEVKSRINEGAVNLLEEKLKINSATEKQEQSPQNFLVLIAAIFFVCLFCIYKFMALLINLNKNKRWFNSDISRIKKMGDFEIKNIIGGFDENKEPVSLKKLVETGIKAIEANINSMEKDGNKGKDFSDIKLWLKFAKDKYKKGHIHLAKRYMDKIKSEIMEGI